MKYYSQNGEDLFILELFKGAERKLRYVELGAGDGVHFSNCRLLKENGWTGVSVDADNKGNSDVIEAFITKENVLSIVANFDVDFLSIDLDGNDYWILDKILQYFEPKCICFEINSQLHNEFPTAINYNAERSWDGSYAYGMNYTAGFALMKKHGYEVIKCVNNTNLIAVKQLVGIEDCKATYSHPEIFNSRSYFVKL